MRSKKGTKIAAILSALAVLSSVAYADIYLRKTPSEPKASTQYSQPKKASPPRGAIAPPPAQEKQATKTAQDFATMIANACIGERWETQQCLRSVSENVMVMTINYYESLEKRGKGTAAETIKQECAAATAATQDEFPAYAMKSAYTGCVNALYETNQKTGVNFDLSQYQLLVGAVQCLDKTPTCTALEKGLSAYKR